MVTRNVPTDLVCTDTRREETGIIGVIGTVTTAVGVMAGATVGNKLAR
ncbi:protein of unknown function [Candidatus Filomicrobium marinum]|uniref:Uncharacterized protein n=1 Tax=Candidatus Filomicrobium marinum TaxID=1608628 RepID=A0A0D6JKR1_9HYPH|nr:protein of unknown function [Candidatus Filomicrobium marinum]